MIVLELIVGGIAAGAVYGLIALGLVVIHSSSNIVNFAQGSIAAIAAYVFIGAPSQMPLIAKILLVIVVAAVIAVLIQVTVVTWASRFEPMNAVLATVALLLITDSVIRYIWGPTTLTFPRFLPSHKVSVGPLDISVLSLTVIGVVVVTAALFWAVMQYTSVGLIIRGTADNPKAARLMGISPAKVAIAVWIVGGVLAAIAGLLLGHLVTLRPEMGLNVLIKAFAGAVVGGFHSPLGALSGAVLLGITEALTAYYIGSLFQDAIPLLLLILVLTLKPSGLFATQSKRAV